MNDLNSTEQMIYEIESAFNHNVLGMTQEQAEASALDKIQHIRKVIKK